MCLRKSVLINSIWSISGGRQEAPPRGGGGFAQRKIGKINRGKHRRVGSGGGRKLRSELDFQ